MICDQELAIFSISTFLVAVRNLSDTAIQIRGLVREVGRTNLRCFSSGREEVLRSRPEMEFSSG